MMRTKVAPDYSARLSVVVPRPLGDAVADAASKSLTSVNSYVRGAVLAKLRADGFESNEAA
jgi:hypothetical protein